MITNPMNTSIQLSFRRKIMGSRRLAKRVVDAKHPNATETLDILMEWKKVIQCTATINPIKTVKKKSFFEKLK
jgi:hypothetical protein